MQTIADQIYPQDFTSIQAVVAAIQEDNLPAAEKRLGEAQATLNLISNEPRKIQMQLFSNALRCRLEAQDIENLYLVPDTGKQIKAFNFMAEKFPVVSSAQALANKSHLEALSGQTSFTIMDIGIGTGQQLLKLFRQLAESGQKIQSVCVIGIEPAAESLSKAEAAISEVLQEQAISLKFLGLQASVESLRDKEWEQLEQTIRSAPGPLLVNASFALHHVQPVSFRDELFRRLKAFSPATVVIIEPYADYVCEDLETRFRNAWHHYGLTFQAIDAIKAEDDVKSSVKEVFFGREMIDVLAQGDRIEKFETAEMWIRRLVQAGFAIRPLLADSDWQGNPETLHGADGSYVGFSVDGHPIVAVIGAY